jgi:hypothetical protein
MITQEIKRWLYKLFSWWPWRQSSASLPAQPVSNLNRSTSQDTLLRTADGTIPPTLQSGIASIVAEQSIEGTPPDSHSEYLVSPGSPLSPEDLLSQPDISPPTHPSLPPLSDVTLTFEQKLSFIKFLVDKGYINEGFDHEKTDRL